MSTEKSSKRRLEKQERPSRKRASRALAAEITVEIDLPSSQLAQTIYATLLPETRSQPRGFRSHTAVGVKDRVVILNIKADDIVAMRAASNTYLRFVQVALKTIKAVSPFYRAADREPELPGNLGKKN